MAENLQNTSDVDTNVVAKAAMVMDLNSSYVSKEMYSYARNAVRNTKDGDLGTISNEPSTSKCFSAPYKIIGNIELPDDTQVIFSTDNTSSEIGIADTKRCIYKKLLNSSCLNFNDKFLVTGKAKKDFQKNVIIYFTDKNNPVRRMDIGNVSESCDDILFWKKIEHPCIKVRKGQVGNMPNGSYSVVIAYTIDDQVFSDYLSITNRVQLFSETGNNSLDLEVSGLDTDFDEYSLVVVATYVDPKTKGVTKVAKKVGNYSTKVTKISLTDFINSNYLDIKTSDLLLRKTVWLKAGIIESNANYLLMGDLVARKEENYQLKAMSIKAQYIVQQVPANYYETDGEDIGYYRDENYDFYIQGVYNTGDLTDKFHIGGRKAKSSDLALMIGPDVYEYDKQFNDCEDPGRIPTWKVGNTAAEMIPENSEFICDRRILGRGEMGYFESTEPWPDNKDMFGDDAGKPQRFHKMPDEAIVPRTSVVNGKTYINIIGVRFFDIPKFDNPDIIGYKITRSDRKGGNGTVQARGIMTNVRYYEDKQLSKTILYSNYNVNNLGADPFLSSTQTVFKNGGEHNFTPLTGFYDNKFSFYSPHTLFEPRYSLGTEVKIESEEIAQVDGKFELVYNHPKGKLLNQFSFWLSAAIGFIESVLVLAGKSSSTGKSILSEKGVTAGAEFEFDKNFNIRTVEDLIGLDIIGYISSQIKAGAFDNVFDTIKTVLIVIGSLGLKVPYSLLSGIKMADDIFNIIYNFTGYTDYVYQYNAHALFNKSIPTKSGNKRRRVTFPATYIPPTVVTVNDQEFNNLLREKCVYLELNKGISNPSIVDTSCNTISGFVKCSNPFDNISSTGSAFYATVKTVNPNQYGQIGSSQPVSIHSCVLSFDEDKTPVLYGGDCVIERFQFSKKMPFFSQDLANTNFPPGVEYDYRKYRNIAYPRFWTDTTKFDFSELLSSNVVNFARFSRTTASKHNLDCKKGDKKSPSRIDDAYMYLSSNCVMDFFVEADYNVGFREKTDIPHYSKSNTNLSDLFRSDKLPLIEEFEISRAYFDLYTTEIFAQQQRHDFSPLKSIPINQPNSVIYSLPSFNLQQADNWRYFLPANFFAFSETDFGLLNAIHKLDGDRIGFLFSKASPFVSMGRSLLQLNGQTVTIGDGALFAQDPREIMPTDENYGACTSKYAFSSNRFGKFYPSEGKGMIMNLGEGLADISDQGVSFWCKNYMPIALYKYFPDYPEIENPVSGVGYVMAFDSSYKTLYITKRDFSPKRELAANISYDIITEKFLYKGKEISLRDDTYFNDISWTISYSPGEKSFISFHDWHPDWVIQSNKHFMTVKGDSVWKHNERFDSFCNFYDRDFPFVIEIVSSSGQQKHTVRSIEYVVEAYHYKNFGRDRFHVLNQNFDGLIVRNTEQISPYLNLVHSSQDPEKDILYPKKNISTDVSYDILFNKEENAYRINQFWDAVKDRGEFSGAEIHLFPTDESGYKSIINPVAVDMNKAEEERKKFRHYFNMFRFSKETSDNTQLVMKIANFKKLISIR